MRGTLAAALAGLSLLAGAALAAPAIAAPIGRDTTAEVASFVQPTPAARLETLKSLLDAYGLPYEVQAFDGGVKDRPAKGYNVVVTLGSGERDLLLTAHYDAKVLKDGTLAGAVIDNAASVVALIHAAEALKGEKLHHRLRVIFFDQEELGLLGAQAYAAGPDGSRADAVFNFDINGYGDTPFFADPKQAPLAGAIRAACISAGQACQAFAAYPPSDHLAFRGIGVPATSISILPAEEMRDLWLMMNGGGEGLPDDFQPRVLEIIHTPQDRMDLIEPGTVDRASSLAVALVKAADASR